MRIKLENEESVERAVEAVRSALTVDSRVVADCGTRERADALKARLTERELQRVEFRYWRACR